MKFLFKMTPFAIVLALFAAASIFGVTSLDAQDLSDSEKLCEHPDHPQTEIEAAACWQVKADNVEKELNEVYGKLVAQLKAQSKVSELESLRKEERAWIKSREKTCHPPRTEDDGSGYATDATHCMYDLAQKRIDKLKARLDVPKK